MFSLQFIDKTHFFIRTCFERVSRVKYNRSVVSEKRSFFLLSNAKHAACVLYINTSRNRRTRTACTIWLFFSSGVFRLKNLWCKNKTVFTAAGVVNAGRYRVRIPLSQGHTTISTSLFRSKPPWHPTKWIHVTISTVSCAYTNALHCRVCGGTSRRTTVVMVFIDRVFFRFSFSSLSKNTLAPNNPRTTNRRRDHTRNTFLHSPHPVVGYA